MFIETLGIDSNDLNEQYLQQRILGADREEGKTIDYKKKFEFACETSGKISWKGVNRASQYEFLRDISSFANTNGGVIFYGINAPQGIPIKINGLNIPKNAFELIENHLDDLLRDHIEPPITVGYHHTSLENARQVYALIIPRSLTGPYQLVFEEGNKPIHKEFWARSDAKKKYQLGVGQLRDAFRRSQALIDEVAQFKANRIKFASNGFAISKLPFNGNAMTLLHLIPIGAFDVERKQYDTNSVFREEKVLVPMFRTGNAGFLGSDPTIRSAFNFDGVKKCCFYKFPTKSELDASERTVSYPYTCAQLFTNGIVEAIERIKLNTEKHIQNQKRIDISSYEEGLINALRNYLETLQKLRVAPRIFLFLTLCGVKGYELGRSLSSTMLGGQIDRDTLEIAASPIDTYNIKPETILKPCFDSIWNACGYPESLNYDDDGNYDVRGSDQRLKKWVEGPLEKN